MLKNIKRKLKKPNPAPPTPVDVLTGYALWAESYAAEAHNPLMEVEQRAMLSLLPEDLAEKTCLDLACGSGRYLLLLQARRAERLFGLDYSAEMLARANGADLAGKLSRSPFYPLPFVNESLDLIVCGMAVGHEKDLRELLLEAARVLRPGGVIIYSDLHPLGALLGWQRTFTAKNGATFELEHHLHLYSDHQAACSQAGLSIETILEPVLDQTPAAQVPGLPAILVVKAVKSSNF